MDGNAAPALGRTQSLAEAQAAVPLWGTDLMNEINQAAKARAQALDSQGGKDGVVSMPQQAQVKGHKKSRSLV
jgi:hypothetical protein